MDFEPKMPTPEDEIRQLWDDYLGVSDKERAILKEFEDRFEQCDTTEAHRAAFNEYEQRITAASAATTEAFKKWQQAVQKLIK
ncbi:hypothetical protein HZA86_01360 [Candidatus Uhrbacteria bacterium]|nr:hypothetical protein [Candidatus Uhrbacteria bacterium]